MTTQRLKPAEHMPSLRDFLAIVFKHKWGVLLLFSVIVTTVTVLTYVWPFSFEASSKILVKFERESTPLSGQTAISPKAVMTMKGTEEDILSEIEILNNKYLIEKVVKTLWDDLTRVSDERPVTLWQQIRLYAKRILHQALDALNEIGYLVGLTEKLGPFESQVARLQKNLKVEAMKDSNVILVRYTSWDPGLAARVINTLTGFYLEQHKEVHRIQHAREFFTDQSDLIRTQLRKQEESLDSFKKTWDISSVEIQKKLLLENIADLHLEHKNLQSRIKEKGQNIAEMQDSLSRRSNYLHKDDMPSSVTGADIVSRDIEKEILLNTAELEGMKAKNIIMEKQIEAYHERNRILDEKEMELHRMERERNILEDNYKTYLSRLENTRISEALDLANISNVSIIEPATVPFSPVRRIPFMPRRMLHVTAGIIAGLITGLGYAFLAEYLNHTFYSAEEAERLLNIQCLASFPKE